ncbi:MAG: hypothetical protein KC910_03705 [Candidatus Eremiobacteraeota bacterium]|nr:hypothetical protein [Candidatus Eremiobacteraeota bacterium]
MSFLEELIKEGAVEERKASFSLAMDKAKEKLKRFQLPDPNFYILQLIQGLIASGATEIHADYDRRELREDRLKLYFNGPGYDRFELETLYDHLFSSGRDRSQDRTRELALAIVSCQALNPSVIRLDSNGFQWRKTPETNQLEQVVKSPPEKYHFFEIEVETGGKDVGLLQTHCHNCRIVLTLNGNNICSESTLYMGTPWPNHRFEGDEVRGAVGLGYGQMEQTSLTFLRYGVQICRRWEKRIHPPVAMIVESESVRKNASQSDMVEDEAYFACITKLQDVLLSLSQELGRRRIPSYQRDTVFSYLLAFFDEWLSARDLEDLSSLPENLQKLLDICIFADIKGRLHSLRNIKTEYDKEGQLSLATKKLPYAKIPNDWLVLCPTERQVRTLRKLFPKVHFVNGDLVRASRQGRRDQVETAESMAFLMQTQAAVGNAHFMVGVPNQHPSGVCRVVCASQKEQRGVESEFRGWSLFAQTSFRLAQLERMGLQAIEQMAPELFAGLEAQIVMDTEHQLRRFRAREHLMSYWSWLLSSMGDSLTLDPQVRQQRARSALGEKSWQAAVFETRQQEKVSLADISRWLAEFGSVTVAFGGPKNEDDHALDASTASHQVLETIFGDPEVVEASFEEPRMAERKHQVQLAGAAQAEQFDPLPETKTAEQEQAELDRLKAEFHQVLEAPPEEAELSADEPAPLPPPVPIPVFGEATSSPSQTSDESAQTDKTRSQRERELSLLLAAPKLVGKSFKREGLAGYLCVPRTGANTIVIYQQDNRVGEFDPGEIRASGWVDIPGAALSADEQTVLERELDELYQLLADSMIHLEPHEPEFRRGQVYLYGYVAARRERVLRQLELGGHSPLTRLHFLPASGQSLTSLDALYQVTQQTGRLRVAEPGLDDPGQEQVVAELGGLLTETYYQQLFGCPIDKLEKPQQEPPEQKLLKALRREFSRICADPELGLPPELLTGLGWGEPTRFFQLGSRYYIHHRPHSGTTEINPAHGLVKKVLKSFEKDPRMVPVLVSSVYTAINKALEEVEDYHELAFLEALLDSHPNG